ncbi:MAG: hypothetical protein M3Q07_24455 [Pseudobdellovibrionaceae bacterium]|nr:hypothetical protein [Pseudobdellovibrionaceae bacterium]
MKKVKLILSLLALLQLACTKDDDKKTDLVQGSLIGKTYYVVQAGDLQRTETSVSGTGSIVFNSPLGSIPSKDNYALNLSVDDGGTLELVTHSDSSLANGVSVLLKRTGSSLTASLKAKGQESTAKELSGVNAAEDISLAIDVHNDETPAHILVWSAAGGDFGEDNALLNSEEDETSPGNGSGTSWGLILTKANVSSALLEDPKFVE